jgi:2,3-bisphosphoglycerate-independent phosphoglycerate mutase
MSSDSKTRYLILVPDGAADFPIPELDNMTPLGAANTPNMDKLANSGRIGLARTIPQGMDPGSDVANLSIIGFSPKEVYTGRAPLEAASMGVELSETDLAFRLNLVTLNDNYTTMKDHSADHITTQESRELVRDLSRLAARAGFDLFPGVSYRHLLVWPKGPDRLSTFPPHDFPGLPIDARFPKGSGSDALLRFIVGSWKILESHPVNEFRMRRGQGPANSVWPWGQGRKPEMVTHTVRFGITGSVISAVDLLRGIGRLAGLEAKESPDWTGYLDTNYASKVQAALEALETQDLAFIHVEAPDETGHGGKLDLKIKAIEDFDAQICGPALTGMARYPNWRVLLMPDHYTPISLRTHSPEPVPFAITDSESFNESKEGPGFNERAAKDSGLMIEKSHELIEVLLGRRDM